MRAVAVVAAAAGAWGAEPQCRQFQEIYSGGKDLCEKLWGTSFKYEEDESKAYTMWFFDQVNPNDATTKALYDSGMPLHGYNDSSHKVESCHLDYYHKDAPSPEPANFTECLPWKEKACCHRDTVSSKSAINNAYGAEYKWDRCGPLTSQCERFMVQEACFYECEPAAGLFRRHHDWHLGTEGAGTYNSADDDHNNWEIYKMPIKASYCNAWFQACRHDKFCGDGDFWSCARQYKAQDDREVVYVDRWHNTTEIQYVDRWNNVTVNPAGATAPTQAAAAVAALAALAAL